MRAGGVVVNKHLSLVSAGAEKPGRWDAQEALARIHRESSWGGGW